MKDSNKRFKELLKKYNNLQAEYTNDPNTTYWAELYKIKNMLADYSIQDGFIQGLNKLNIIKLVSLQSSLRFMPEHRFYICFANALHSIETK